MDFPQFLSIVLVAVFVILAAIAITLVVALVILSRRIKRTMESIEMAAKSFETSSGQVRQYASMALIAKKLSGLVKKSKKNETSDNYE